MSSPDCLIAEVRLLNKIQAIILEQRLALVLIFNSVLWAAVYSLALLLRFDFDPNQALLAQYFTVPLSLLLFFRLLAYKYWDLNQGYWR